MKDKNFVNLGKRIREKRVCETFSVNQLITGSSMIK